MNTTPKRPYRMTARAESAARTGERIIDAAVEMFSEEPSRSISLDGVAHRAGVTVQTVIRRFGDVRACSPPPPSARPAGSARNGTWPPVTSRVRSAC